MSYTLLAPVEDALSAAVDKGLHSEVLLEHRCVS